MKNRTLIVAVFALIFVGGIAIVALRLGAGSSQVAAGIISVDASSVTQGEATTTGEVADPSVPAAISESVPTTPAVTADMQGYSNKNFHFGLLFPKNLVAREYKEAGGALTVSFQDPNTSEGFQVYVVPYAGKQIDTARFKLDQPSGVMKEPKDVIIDGARGTIFFGYNPIMGETREVWFIRGGYLYEVTSYKELDAWLGGIMQTWKFL